MEQTALLRRIKAGYNEVPVPVKNTLLGQVCGVCLYRKRQEPLSEHFKQADELTKAPESFLDGLGQFHDRGAF